MGLFSRGPSAAEKKRIAEEEAKKAEEARKLAEKAEEKRRINEQIKANMNKPRKQNGKMSHKQSVVASYTPAELEELRAMTQQKMKKTAQFRKQSAEVEVEAAQKEAMKAAAAAEAEMLMSQAAQRQTRVTRMTTVPEKTREDLGNWKYDAATTAHTVSKLPHLISAASELL
jgi:hypothetical protein